MYSRKQIAYDFQSTFKTILLQKKSIVLFKLKMFKLNYLIQTLINESNQL